MSAPAIAVEDVSKSFLLPHQRHTSVKERFLHPLRRVDYEQNRALSNVSFTVERGECFGVIGPNGSGKSTLLKILAGIYRADAGSVRVAGRLSPFIELGVGFHPELNARDNIRVNAMLLGLTSKEVAERFDGIVAFAELERFVDQKLKNYSSGMQVRLAFAIAIQVPFDILLLDEVLAVGDQSFQKKCFATFERFRTEGKTVVLVSHDIGAVSTYCDRALLLESGVGAALGPADEVVARYEHRERMNA
jgi:ABC-type polysaccharide/polyol phosphate transport system ATPase subunit